MGKKFGFMRKRPNFHNMSAKQIEDWIRRNRGSHECVELVEEAYEWIQQKAGTTVVESEVLDSHFRGAKGRGFK